MELEATLNKEPVTVEGDALVELRARRPPEVKEAEVEAKVIAVWVLREFQFQT